PGAGPDRRQLRRFRRHGHRRQTVLGHRHFRGRPAGAVRAGSHRNRGRRRGVRRQGPGPGLARHRRQAPLPDGRLRGAGRGRHPGLSRRHGGIARRLAGTGADADPFTHHPAPSGKPADRLRQLPRRPAGLGGTRRRATGKRADARPRQPGRLEGRIADMNLNDILDALFPAGHAVTVANQVITGQALTAQGTVAVLGTTDAAAIDHAMALALSDFILDTVDRHPGRPLVFLVDTCGQALSRSQELLCLVTANAVSGGFLSFGLMADQAYALAEAQVRVMDLRAMARVTKIAHERLVELAASSPIFAPGAESYRRMGGIAAIWPAPSAALLEEALTAARQAAPATDQRMASGLTRDGRQLAADIAQAVDNAVIGA